MGGKGKGEGIKSGEDGREREGKTEREKMVEMERERQGENRERGNDGGTGGKERKKRILERKIKDIINSQGYEEDN